MAIKDDNWPTREERVQIRLTALAGFDGNAAVMWSAIHAWADGNPDIPEPIRNYLVRVGAGIDEEAARWAGESAQGVEPESPVDWDRIYGLLGLKDGISGSDHAFRRLSKILKLKRERWWPAKMIQVRQGANKISSESVLEEVNETVYRKSARHMGEELRYLDELSKRWDVAKEKFAPEGDENPES